MVSEKYKKIMNKVLEIIEKETPVTTKIVADKMKVNWMTAHRSLCELEKKGKVRGKKISGRCVWVVK